MATFKICVFKHHERKDGKFRVSIRLRHNNHVAYLKTDTYVVRKQIAMDFGSLRDADVARRIDRDIIEYEKILLRGLGSNLSRFTAKELIDYITKYTATDGGAGIDFVAFSNAHIEELRAKGRKSYAQGFESVLRALIDFYKKDTIYIKEITGKNLKAFAEYMQKERTMTRINQHGNEYQITRPGVKDQTITDYIKVIQTLFNEACDKYNDEDGETAIITHNPFRKIKIKVSDEPEKRDLLVEDLIKIINHTGGSGRLGLARDVFLISFYLIGMNTADIFNVEASAISDGRITYKRQKTTTRRKDEAIMSIRIEPEVEALFKKYRDPFKKKAFRFYRTYADHRTFNGNVNKGLKQLAKELDIEPNLSTYYARHTVATIAYNHCDFSENEIGVALNHVSSTGKDLDNSLKVTRGYINRDWSRIDKFNRTVLDYVDSKIK